MAASTQAAFNDGAEIHQSHKLLPQASSGLLELEDWPPFGHSVQRIPGTSGNTFFF
jgi:hypothetical protein